MTEKIYKPKLSEFFKKDYVRIIKKNRGFQEQTDKKFLQVLENPDSYKNLKRPLQKYKRTQIGSFVITFRIEGEFVRFVRFEHHDKIYKLPHD